MHLHVRAIMPLLALFIVVSVAHAVDYGSGVKTKEVLKSAATVSGRDVVYPRTGRPVVTAMTVELPPGVETGWHTHPVPAYAWVVSGTLTVEFEGGKILQFNEGDAIIEAVNTPQNGRNIGAVPVKLLVFYTGAEDVPNVVRTPVYESGLSGQGKREVTGTQEIPARQELQNERQVTPDRNVAPPEKKDDSVNIKLRYKDPVIE